MHDENGAKVERGGGSNARESPFGHKSHCRPVERGAWSAALGRGTEWYLFSSSPSMPLACQRNNSEFVALCFLLMPKDIKILKRILMKQEASGLWPPNPSS
jgi:hypothetical protein